MIPLLAVLVLALALLFINEGAPSSPFAIITMIELDALSISTPLLLAATNYVCDSASTKTYASGCWRLTLTKGAAKKTCTVTANHNGSTGADATTTQLTVLGLPNSGTVDVTISAALSGAGSSQVLQLVCNAATTGWTARSWRIPLLDLPA